jgi:hypothetical protein
MVNNGQSWLIVNNWNFHVDETMSCLPPMTGGNPTTTYKNGDCGMV